ncbi:hypothetical protein C8J57DRAFT_1527312 [Mycena rebaudengoi]|nr:hypothetical protein C8J57DRAFT_1527312 [Mycena rebaudengoi]
MDLWVYLRNNECHAVLPILDMLFCDMEDNHSEVVCLLEDASTPLLKHLSTWMSVPPETVQFLAQLRHAAIFAQQIKPLSSKLKLLKEQLPKKLTSPILLTPSFEIPPKPCCIKSMAELSFSSDEEDDANNHNLVDPPADLDDQPELPAEDDVDVVEEELAHPKKHKKVNPPVDEDYEDEVTELSTPMGSCTSPVKTCQRGARSTAVKVNPSAVPVASSSKVKTSTSHLKCYILIPPQSAPKTPVSKPTAGTTKVEQSMLTKKTPAVKAGVSSSLPAKIIQTDADMTTLPKCRRILGFRARNKTEVPNPEAVPTATMILPLAQVHAAQINPDELNMLPICLLQLRHLWQWQHLHSQDFHKSYLSLLLNNMISLDRQYDFHTALIQLYLDNYLQATEDLAFAMCAVSQSITWEALEARFSDASAVDAIDIFFKQLQLTPDTAGFPENDHSHYSASLPTQTDLSGRLWSPTCHAERQIVCLQGIDSSASAV